MNDGAKSTEILALRKNIESIQLLHSKTFMAFIVPCNKYLKKT